MRRSGYDVIVAFSMDAYVAASLSPPDLQEWRTLAERHRLATRYSWWQLLAARIQLASLGIHMPSNLADTDISEVRLTSHNPPPAHGYFGRYGLFLALFPPLLLLRRNILFRRKLCLRRTRWRRLFGATPPSLLPMGVSRSGRFGDYIPRAHSPGLAPLAVYAF